MHRLHFAFTATSLIVAVLSSASSSFAEEPRPPFTTTSSPTDETSRLPVATDPPPSEKARRGEWYGWQTLLTDASAVLLIVPVSKAPVLGYAGIGMYGLGAPIVHLAHGNPGRAAGSFALRTVLPVAGCAIGYAMFQRPDRPGEWINLSGFAGCFLLGLGGIVAASGLDAGLLARESPPPSAAASVRAAPTLRSASARRWPMAPTLFAIRRRSE